MVTTTPHGASACTTTHNTLNANHTMHMHTRATSTRTVNLSSLLGIALNTHLAPYETLNRKRIKLHDGRTGLVRIELGNMIYPYRASIWRGMIEIDNATYHPCLADYETFDIYSKDLDALLAEHTKRSTVTRYTTKNPPPYDGKDILIYP